MIMVIVILKKGVCNEVADKRMGLDTSSHEQIVVMKNKQYNAAIALEC